MKILKTMAVGMLCAVLAACGGGGANTLTQQPPTGGGTGGGSAAPTPASITVTSDTSAIFTDGSTTAKITVLALSSSNVLLQGVPITFSASSGGIAVQTGTTDANGAATATLSTGGNPTLRTITITATAGSLTATTTVQVIAKGSTSPAAALTVTTDTGTILSDGSTTATITARVRDASNNLIPNVPVVFSASSGGIAATKSTTDATGTATAVLSTAGDPTLRTITVTASVNALTATVPVQVVSGNTTNSVQLGSGTGANFVPGRIGASNSNLSAGGSTSLQVVLQQSDGTLYTQPATIAFSSPCVAQGGATLTPSSQQTTTGIATITYAATGCNGTDVVTATTTIGSGATARSLSATVTLTVAAANIGSIAFVSVSAPIIALKGIASTALPPSSTVVFKVLDQGGAPRPGAPVTFSLNTQVGGVALVNSTATSDANGQVQTIVQGGTVATPVRVTATVTNSSPAISTQSSQLTISTGIPAQNSFSVAVQCPNVEAWSIDGVNVPVTARVADRFNNPVPNGTAITFFAEAGSITSQCTTAITNGNAACSVNWVSQGVRPPRDPSLPKCGVPAGNAGTCDRDGRVSLLAVAIGEESFTDANGNGQYDVGETFFDVGERYVDSNENGQYDKNASVQEFFYDFNNDNTRNAADGFFNGVLCNDPAKCDPNRSSTGIGAQNLIIMSQSQPNGLVPPQGTANGVLPSFAASSGTVYTFVVADGNNNPMPAGTTVKADITGTGFGLGTPSSYTVPCATEPTAAAFIVTTSNVAPGARGTLTVTVTTPGAAGQANSGVATVFVYSFTAT